MERQGRDLPGPVYIYHMETNRNTVVEHMFFVGYNIIIKKGDGAV